VELSVIRQINWEPVQVVKIMKNIYQKITILSLIFFPFVTHAQSNVNELIGKFLAIVNRLVPLIIAIAVLAFLWGMLRYVVSDSPEKRKEAIGVIIYGVIAIFVMVSVWGLVNVLVDTFNFGPHNGVLQIKNPPFERLPPVVR